MTRPNLGTSAVEAPCDAALVRAVWSVIVSLGQGPPPSGEVTGASFVLESDSSTRWAW